MRGRVTLVFDDGYQSTFNNVLPILDKHAIPGVFAIVNGRNELEQKALAPTSAWHSINPRHELAGHSHTHVDLTKVSSEQLEYEINQFSGKTLVYPGGAHNDLIIAVAKKYYKAGRTVQKGFNKLNPSDLYRLKTYNFTRNNFSVLKANMLAIWAWLTNSWLIETYHIVMINIIIQ